MRFGSVEEIRFALHNCFAHSLGVNLEDVMFVVLELWKLFARIHRVKLGKLLGQEQFDRIIGAAIRLA